jgi:hypothetical protein
MGKRAVWVFLFLFLLSGLSSFSAEPIADQDSDGIVDIDDQCPETLHWEYVDRFGCSWLESDYDSDGLLNSEDPCPTVYRVQCGLIESEYMLGYRNTTKELFEITNLIDFNYFSIIPWHAGGTGFAIAGEHCSLGISKVIGFAEDFDLWEKCNIDSAAEQIRFSPDGNQMVSLDQIYTGHWATEYDVLQTKWGNYTPESYCCHEKNYGDMDFQPRIIDFDFSPNGDFVVWVEDHMDSESEYPKYYREIRAWHNGSQPELLFRMEIQSGIDEDRIGAWVDISHDGRYILSNHGKIAGSPYRNIVLDSHTGEIVSDFHCQNQVWMHKSNNVACTKSGMIEFLSVESNSSYLNISSGINYVMNLESSPSDNHLMLRENMGNSLKIIDLKDNSSQVYDAPFKDGFEEPVIYGSTFYHTDELILIYVEYQKNSVPCCVSSEDRHEVQLLGFDYDGDGVISALDNCKGTGFLPEDFFINSEGCLEEISNHTTNSINPPSTDSSNTSLTDSSNTSLTDSSNTSLTDSSNTSLTDSSNNNLKDEESEQYLSDSDITMISIGFMVLIPCFIFLHKPTLRSVTNTIRSISPNAVGLERVERQREELGENLSFEINTESLSNILLAPFVIMYYCMAGVLIAMFYLIQIYLIVAGYALLIVFGGTMFIILLPFFLFAFIFG